jgi:hypothetical protein
MKAFQRRATVKIGGTADSGKLLMPGTLIPVGWHAVVRRAFGVIIASRRPSRIAAEED